MLLKRVLILVLLIGISGCSKNPDIKPLHKTDVIVAFGDSLTFGTGAQAGYSYPATLEKLIGIRVINAGVPGDTTDKSLVRLPSVLNQYHPALVILCIGGNDILRRRSEAHITMQLEKIIEMIKHAGAQVILIGVPNTNYDDKAARFYGDVAENQRIPVDMEILPQLFLDGKYLSDPIHLDNAGYQALAVGIQHFMKKIGLLPAKS